MPLLKAEENARLLVESIFKQLTPETVTEKDAIRGAALATFSKALESALRSIQNGEMLQVTFRIDILDAEGKVIGGPRTNRNMPEYAEWRKAVYERDHYCCRECGQRGGELNAHHIQAWATHPDLRFDLDNGITLCFDCHAKKHPHLRFMVKHGTSNETDE